MKEADRSRNQKISATPGAQRCAARAYVSKEESADESTQEKSLCEPTKGEPTARKLR